VDGGALTDTLEIERVYKEDGNRLWWALVAYTGNRELASDAAAEAFARALHAADRIEHPAGWVWRVAFRVATAILREPERPLVLVPASYEIDDRTLGVLSALRQLSGRQRAAFVLYYLDDRTTAQIGELLGMAPATVSVHLHRARNRLRTILRADDE
jgi:RNA polymerase sigma factor (sigma-70 family)